MNEKALNILEYKKIIELLTAEATCRMSKDMAKNLCPDTNIRAISEELRSTTQAVDLIVHKGSLPTEGIYDIERIVSLAEKGGVLTAKQLLMVHYNLSASENVVSFIKSDIPDIPLIISLVELIVAYPNLRADIDRCILSEDEIADNASSGLKQIRREIKQKNDSIRNKLNHIANSQSNRQYLQDTLVTIKDGRYVIPVKQEHRSRFPGIVHDQSRAGATLFIEPQQIVNMNNELRELEIAENVEIAKILQELSDRVAEAGKDLINTQRLLTRLDFIMAKGKLSLKMKGNEPGINEEGIMVLKQARHPLIDAEKVVPISVTLGKDFRSLVITGPNTGGKTVTLKTIGLLSVMAQSGLHIPALAISNMPIFENIFADIGDEQSIEQSLSTFSSHMKNIVEIVNKSGKNTLVLVDELGAGTDPTEGAALAISILDSIFERGAITVATTHYNEIKKYAISTPGVENASMEFDVETLSPTYRLRLGTPGKSNAFLISSKLGLPENIIQRAEKLLKQEDVEFEDVLLALEEDKKRAELERDEAVKITEAIRNEQRIIEQKKAEFEAQKEKLLADARVEARKMIKEAKETAMEVKKELRNLSKLESLGERNKNFDINRERLREKEKKFAERAVQKVNSSPVSADDLKIGDTVRVLSLNQNGEILTLPDVKGELQIQLGIMKMNVKISDIMLIVDGKKSRKKQNSKAVYGNLLKNKTMSVKTSCNVQGENLDSARMEVEKYLDDAFMAGLKSIYIIHGKGNGILQKGIREYLKRNKHVASFKAGNYNEGGEGVTVVTLKME